MMTNVPVECRLVPVAGATFGVHVLSATDQVVEIGRLAHCGIRLPADATLVSRRHAEFSRSASGEWQISDLGSRTGTYVNGHRLGQGEVITLAEGDLIRVSTWVFRFTSVSTGQSSMSTLGSEPVLSKRSDELIRSASPELLVRILEAATTLNAARNEREWAHLTHKSATLLTGLDHIAVIRSSAIENHYDVLAPVVDATKVRFSRTLIRAAASGNVAMFDDVHTSHSISDLGMTWGVCVPLVLDGTPVAFLYVHSAWQGDARHANHAAVLAALGQIASLTLANLLRSELRQRQARLAAEIEAASRAQKWILPVRSNDHGPLRVIGESRPGQLVGGDFFDIVPVGETCLAVTLGDVVGHGVASGIVMTSIQGFLHATLRHVHDPAEAARQLNAFAHPRLNYERFVTLWIGVVDWSKHTLHWVDCGHGFAVVRRADGSIQPLRGDGDFPVGIEPDHTPGVCSTTFAPGDRIVVVSDGLLEQTGEDALATEFFGPDRFHDLLRPPRPDHVADLFEAVYKWAGSQSLKDDATAVQVDYGT